MNCLLLVVYLMSLLDSVLSSLPAPVNVSVSSVNFQHILRWDPGPGTPPGTRYMIRRQCGRKRKWLRIATTTSFKLKLKDQRMEYCLSVQASYNQTLSPEGKFTFSPYKDTKIDPPKVSLAGCGNCIQINISLPEADRSSGINDIQKFYDSEFRVSWKKRSSGKEVVEHNDTKNKSFTLNNLKNGTEYCVQVHTKIRINENTEPSAWNCTFTSSVEPSRGPVLLGTVAALLIFVISCLMIFAYCLYTTGFLCKPKATLPRALIVVLSHGYTLTPEKAILDQISISSEMEKQRTHKNPTTPQPATRGANMEENEEEDEEEDEEGINVYMDRDAELSSGGGSCQDSANVSGNRTLAASGDSGSLTAEAEAPDAEFEVAHGGLDQDEAKAEGAQVSFIPDGGQTGVQGHATGEEEEEVCDCSGNVNLFSVTLAALAVCEEEEQNTRDSLTDFLKLSDLEPLLPTDSKWTLSHTDSQTVSDDQTDEEDFTGCEGRRADTLSGCLKTCDGETQHEETQEEEEEEEEEEFSGYMRHT